MHVETLRITNMRAIESAELRFSSGFNLLVGVNGVGKTTVPDALAYCLSSAKRELNGLRLAPCEPTGGDIRFGSASMTLECGIVVDGRTTLERELAARLDGGELAPYSGVAVWWLSVRLRSIS